MTEKAKLPKQVAEAIEYFRSIGYMNRAILDEIECESKNSIGRDLEEFADKSDDNFDILLTALVNGYEVEQTPEDKVREQFSTPRHFVNKDEDTDADIYRKGIKFALDTLGIKIEGVNA